LYDIGDMDDPDGWRWIWLAATVFLAIGELATPGAFFMLSFAIGAAIACVLAFAGADLVFEWLGFVVGSAAALALLVPIGRRMSKGEQAAVGATRFRGRRAVVLQTIPGGPNETGLVRLDREEWRAESAFGFEIPVGATVVVQGVDGTRLVVAPLEDKQ
jgi:membrane protein implicated in regulation of membrane protease activity